MTSVVFLSQTYSGRYPSFFKETYILWDDCDCFLQNGTFKDEVQP